MEIAEVHANDPSVDSASALAADPRWELVQRIAASEPFQKSTRLPALLLYLGRYSILGDRRKLTEQAIGQAVFGKRQHFDPAEDSSVRVNVRQLRLKLFEYYQQAGEAEGMHLSIPKGGYVLEFGAPPQPAAAHVPVTNRNAGLTAPVAVADGKPLFKILTAILAAALVVCAIGWWREVVSHRRSIPWPMNAVMHVDSPTNLVLADAGTSLRMLGNQEITLDNYIHHDYLKPILPKNMSEDEASVFRYLDSTRLTSEADARAAAMLAAMSGSAANLIVKSARDVNSTDLTHGNFIFVGSKTSNPWVEVAEAHMNFVVVENGPHGARYIVNRNPRPGEKATYQSTNLDTLASGDDYAVVALVPANEGSGTWLVLEGVRMEGTNAAISLLTTEAGREKLAAAVGGLNHGKAPKYFEALLHSQSVAGEAMSVDVVSARAIQ